LVIAIAADPELLHCIRQDRHGLSKDWGVSLEEAEATVNRWYADRPEVRQWQADTKSYAFHKGYVNTMIGRRRGLLPGITSSDKWLRARGSGRPLTRPSRAVLLTWRLLPCCPSPWTSG